jgi:PhoPQ-activated pathogenicity-related protein
MLLIDGGSNNSSIPDSEDSGVEALALVAVATNSIVADLKMTPNQPLTFTGETQSRSEDAIIAWSFDRFPKTGDETWAVLLPMVKGAVLAMDTVQSFVADMGGPAIDSFLVTGGSKRGWTTWLTAAVDPRVDIMIPIVFDALNLDIHVKHHFAAYGFYSNAMDDHEEFGIFNQLDTPEGQELVGIVDPYEYRLRYSKIGKVMLNSTGEKFFPSDSAQF